MRFLKVFAKFFFSLVFNVFIVFNVFNLFNVLVFNEYSIFLHSMYICLICLQSMFNNISVIWLIQTYSLTPSHTPNLEMLSHLKIIILKWFIMKFQKMEKNHNDSLWSKFLSPQMQDLTTKRALTATTHIISAATHAILQYLLIIYLWSQGSLEEL